ncbi:uncharacterized protein LOC125509023 [Triticum urartu]|uniref:uncharacterized protein LOC125509023 n=1 Tax=Triticum urartu TaxID=4572 RepID=UPI00204411AC|nr:uncharacterized protein LOC125509023 [Triticum urartu]
MSKLLEANNGMLDGLMSVRVYGIREELAPDLEQIKVSLYKQETVDPGLKGAGVHHRAMLVMVVPSPTPLALTMNTGGRPIMLCSSPSQRIDAKISSVSGVVLCIGGFSWPRLNLKVLLLGGLNQCKDECPISVGLNGRIKLFTENCFESLQPVLGRIIAGLLQPVLWRIMLSALLSSMINSLPMRMLLILCTSPRLHEELGEG